MSNGFWRIEKRIEPFALGNTITERAAEYAQTWQNRCYLDGIPDEVPDKIAASGRAPSWKAVAICILKNDHNLLGLGFAPKECLAALALMPKPEKERELFDHHGCEKPSRT